MDYTLILLLYSMSFPNSNIYNFDNLFKELIWLSPFCNRYKQPLFAGINYGKPQYYRYVGNVRGLLLHK